MRYLKTNTATRITVGPFLNATDGITPEVALTATNEKLTFTVDDAGVPTLVIDATATASGGDNDFVHITGDDAGFYDLELTAAQVNYVGRAMLAVTFATDHCPVFHEFTILPANIYDAMIGGTDLFDVSVTQIAGSAVSTTTAQLGVNAVQISASATAADNVESAFASTLAEESAVPAANAPIWTKLNFLFLKARNKITGTATTQTVFADDGSTTVSTSTVSDDGTTYTRGEFS